MSKCHSGHGNATRAVEAGADRAVGLRTARRGGGPLPLAPFFVRGGGARRGGEFGPRNVEGIRFVSPWR